jgi:chromosome segregation ATPase
MSATVTSELTLDLNAILDDVGALLQNRLTDFYYENKKCGDIFRQIMESAPVQREIALRAGGVSLDHSANGSQALVEGERMRKADACVKMDVSPGAARGTPASAEVSDLQKANAVLRTQLESSTQTIQDLLEKVEKLERLVNTSVIAKVADEPIEVVEETEEVVEETEEVADEPEEVVEDTEEVADEETEEVTEDTEEVADEETEEVVEETEEVVEETEEVTEETEEVVEDTEEVAEETEEVTEETEEVTEETEEVAEETEEVAEETEEVAEETEEEEPEVEYEEIDYKGKTYLTSDPQNGELYGYDDEGEPDLETPVGRLKDGKAKLYKR